MLCGILAGNNWNGWFTRVARNGPRVAIDHDALLTEQEYWFHVPEQISSRDEDHDIVQPYKYPIVPSFQHWKFPHGKPPPGWSFVIDADPLDEPELPPSSVSNTSQVVKDRDKRCCLTGWRDRLHASHLCPGLELQWFRENDMDKYNSSVTLAGPYVTDDMSNQLALRADVHAAFDDRMFIFTRKYGSWVSHFLDATYELGAVYHNCSASVSPSVSPSVHQAFVFARIAWAILPRLRNFLVQADRLVYIKAPSSRNMQEKVLTPSALGDLVGFGSGPKSKSRAAGKRQRDQEDHHANNDAASLNPSASGKAECRRTIEIGCQAVLSSGSLSLSSEARSGMTYGEDCGTSSGCLVEHLGGKDVCERHRIETLRKEALAVQRQSSEHLMCCDYALAETAVGSGVLGPVEYGGSHLCLQCRGAEVDLMDSDDEMPAGCVGLYYIGNKGSLEV